MFGLVNTSQETKLAQDFAKQVKVVATGVEQVTGTLSGGNQQKVLLAKWLIPKPRIIILDQPTRGIDVGAKAEIHRIVSHLATQGIAVILIGDDAEEVMAMSDRILVFRNGRLAAEATRGAYDKEAILMAAAHAAGHLGAAARP
jgi:rhamnose transport system ATP-binding protein